MTIAKNILRDPQDSEECLNDTYIEVWNRIPPARPTMLKAFLATIMRRVAINRYKANRRDKRIASELSASLSDFEDVLSDNTDVREELYAEELGRILSNYVKGLTERERYIFIGRYYFAYPIDTIAQRLGVSRSTVNKEIAAMKGGLKKKLESEGY